MINFNLQVRDFPFNANSQAMVESWRSGPREFGTNWPVVYFIHNDESREAYIGETLNAGRRISQHWENPERQRLKVIHIMTDETFNKSVILDLESFLIKYVSADGRYRLQNGNSGLSDFDYYAREEYEHQFLKVWDALKGLGIVHSGIADIENSDLFKYSPYKSLTADQQDVLNKVVFVLTGYLKHDLEQTIVIEGGAGTGKTILAVFLLKLLTDLANNTFEVDDSTEATDVNSIQALINQDKPLKIGFVVPMQSLRQTLKKVFDTVRGLSSEMILSPVEVPKAAQSGEFDLLICDEAHRLRRRKSLSQYPAYDKNNEMLGLPKDATELDWLMNCSRMQLLFYDPEQSVKPSDIPASVFNSTIHNRNLIRIPLKSQLRCLGGDDYIKYVKDILNCRSVQPHGAFKDYTLRFFDDVDAMMDEINCKDKECGLSCGVAGYAWTWISKGQPRDTAIRDITIGRGYLWNRTYTDWINSDRLPYEVGCIHTVQGYDLNYIGVIFGPEITYDKTTHRIEVIQENYKDSLGRAVSGNYEALREYIINIYTTLLTRGIRGAYVYVCDSALRDYLRPFFMIEKDFNNTQIQFKVLKNNCYSDSNPLVHEQSDDNYGWLAASPKKTLTDD